jgi:hypothetical protein
MARYEVFKEVGESLANLVRLEAEHQKLPVEIVVGPPDAAFFQTKKARVGIYLYDFHVDRHVNQEGDEHEEEVEDETGTFTILFGRPLLVEVKVAVAAAGGSPLEETVLLGLAMKAFFERPVLREELKLGKNLPAFDMPVDIDPDFSLDRKHQLLTSLGVTHHPLVGYRLVTELRPERELHRTRKVEKRTIELYDRHRPPEGKGLGAERAIPKTAAGKGKR